MFDRLNEAVERERLRIQKQYNWIQQFSDLLKTINILDKPFAESNLVNAMSDSIPSITRISGVDGGVVSEAFSGFDVILYRAVGVTFYGIGDRVQAKYTPNFDPEPNIFLTPSLSSRFEFSRISTLLRLLIEYSVATETIRMEKPTILFLDGKVAPLNSDFSDITSRTKGLAQIEAEVKQAYRDLISIAIENDVLVCGVIKDSRSRTLTNELTQQIPVWIREGKLKSEDIKGWSKILPDMLDQNFTNQLLKKGEKTAWQEIPAPNWLPPKYNAKVLTSLIRPIAEDSPIKVEILLTNFDSGDSIIDIAMGALSVLSNHGLPNAIPTIIIEADDRTRLSQKHLEPVVDQISISLGIPKDQLRKRRAFRRTLS
jgi:hypothetical protein